MKHLSSFILAITLALFFCSAQVNAQCVLKSGSTRIEINGEGYFSSINVDGKDILSSGKYPILTACRSGKLILPTKLVANNDLLSVTMADGTVVRLGAQSDKTCVTLEVADVSKKYDAILFGPLQVTIHEIVGDVVGVAQGDGVAFGIQALNIKTNAGIPMEYVKAVDKQYGTNGKMTELSVGTIPTYRLAANDRGEGTLFQFSCRRRDRVEYRTVNNLPNSMVLPVAGPDAQIKGAKIALFGCKNTEALNRIGEIEVKEGLPHPMFGGEWGKTAQSAMKSYMITDFDENNLDFVLDKASKAGISYVYQPDAFEDWGHFNWKRSFTKKGDDGVRMMVEKAKQRGISLGVHTLSNFLTTNDAYVSPIPSSHLLKQGRLELILDISDKQSDLLIRSSNLFDVPMTLNALQIDNELITYGHKDVHGEDIVLSNCVRGAFGTNPAPHSKASSLYKLWDYPYRTLFPDLTLQDSFSDRLAELFNKTGLCQTSFDGLEGCTYTGQDDYATARFVARFYRQLNHNVINDASNLNHYTWHIHSRMNWGEPWGEEMRAGQVENRIKNQNFFRRNLFPRMLGWFLIRLADRKFECTSLEDLEWAMSESAGFDAGYAMTIDVDVLKEHGQIDELLTAMKNWDELRECHAFSEAQKARLRDPSTEWHLEKESDSSYKLYPLYVSKKYHCSLSNMQPGQPGGADWAWTSPFEGAFAIRLKVEGDGKIVDPLFRTEKGIVKFPCELSDGQYLLYSFDGKAVVTDKNYRLIQQITPEGTSLLPTGDSTVAFSCQKSGKESPDVEVRYITKGNPETIRK